MITLNGATFSAGRRNLTPMMQGFYRRYTRSLVLFDRTGERIGVINRHGVLCRATRMGDGRYWYSYGDVDGVGRFAGHRCEVEQIRQAMADTENQIPKRREVA